MIDEDRIERLTYSVPEAARVLGLSRMAAYQAVSEGTIPAIRIGRRILVPRRALERLLEPDHTPETANAE